jgi:hypothetical protein
VLNEAALSVVKRLTARHPLGPILRNRNGKPWTKHSLRGRFRVLRATGQNSRR